MAPRASWKGYLKLSLVSCPVRLYNATTESNQIRFNWLHKDSKNRIQMKPFDPELGQIERSDIVKGYEFEKDRYVIVSDEDLDAIKIESSKTITIEQFVAASEVDTLYLESPYYLAPDGPVGEETYRVLHHAMKTRGKAALARVVMSGRERQVILEVRDKGFVMTTLRTANEVRHHREYFDEVIEGKIEAGALKLAELLITQNEGKFDSSDFEDQYQKALLEVVEAKVKGTEPVIAREPERGKVINLMDALKKSLDAGAIKKPPAKSKPHESEAPTAAAAKDEPKKATAKAATRKRGARAARG